MDTLNFPSRLAALARQRRKQLKITQEHLANLAGCGPVFIIELERGKPTLRLDKLLAVLNVLGLNLAVTDARSKEAL